MVGARGVDLGPFVIEAVQEKLLHSEHTNPITFGNKVHSGWIPPEVAGVPRTDGVAWSELEGCVFLEE
jgi:hypothetical protein